jgi:2-keto-4-pentenoate hydratase
VYGWFACSIFREFVMLMSTHANRYAHQLLDSRAGAHLISPLSAQEALSIADGYDIAKSIWDARVANGEVQVGRKIGFTNRKIWSRYGVTEPIHMPIWTPMFDSTVRYVEDNRVVQSLDGALQPRIGPEVVFRLASAPAPNASLEAIAASIDWMAHAIEIVTCPFPNWAFEEADSIAAFGLHGALLVGEPKSLSSASRRNLPEVLANASLSLSCGDELRSAGFGSDVWGSPVHALWELNRMLSSQPQFEPLRAGEIVTTGTWADVLPIEPGQTWATAFSGVSLPGLTVSFV